MYNSFCFINLSVTFEAVVRKDESEHDPISRTLFHFQFLVNSFFKKKKKKKDGKAFYHKSHKISQFKKQLK